MAYYPNIHYLKEKNAMKKVMTYLLAMAPVMGMAQSTFQSDLADMIEANSEKVISLAEAIPEENYDWSPAEGVRSVKSVVFHIAGANYFFPTFAGTTVPEGIDPQSMEKTVEGKEAIIQALKDSYAHVIQTVSEIPDAKLEEKVDFFGNEMTVRSALLLAYGHCEEHMGQLIAYGRANGITPPWSQSE